MPTMKGPFAPPAACQLSACLLAACLLVALAGANGCSRPAATARETPASGASGATSRAAETRELEEKAAGYKERFQEIQESDMTAEEKAQAAGELVDEQQRTVREAEEGSGGGEEAEQ